MEREDREVAQLLLDKMRRHPWWPRFEQALPGWTIRFERMRFDEVIDWTNKNITVRIWLPDPMFRVAHAIGHIMKHQCARGRASFTEAEEKEADEFAAFYRIVVNTEMEPEEVS